MLGQFQIVDTLQNPLGIKGRTSIHSLRALYRAPPQDALRVCEASSAKVRFASLPIGQGWKRKDTAMKKTDALMDLIISDIESKDVLEVACGTADFSISAARFASSVSCIDLDDSRLNRQIKQTNIHFQIMDASKMDYPDNAFDTIVIYNSFFHIRSHWNEIEHECKRVVKHEGVIYIVGTWKLDTNLIEEIFGDDAKWKDGFLIVKIKK